MNGVATTKRSVRRALRSAGFAVALAMPALALPVDTATADEGPVPAGVCCVCDCIPDATSSQLQPSPTQSAPPGATCIDTASSSGCNSICIDMGCDLQFIEAGPCSETAGCPQAENRSTMAPLVSTGAMIAIAAILALLGHTAARRRAL